MLDDFQQFIESEKMLPPDSRVLLAISGGLDSIAMAYLFRQSGWDFGLAHCNFKLRGDASNGDERFVKDLAQSWGAPFYSITFDTLTEAETLGVSIQMAARELRYKWLEATREKEGYSHIATAHHLNDSIETVLLNWAKGCGIRGLHGIPSQNGNIIRPLLFASRAGLEAFVAANKITFREDASNAEDKYSRNRIRLQAIPALRKINPALEATMAANLERMKEAEYLYDYALDLLRGQIVSEIEGRVLLSIPLLREHAAAMPSLLYEFLSPFGFNTSQAQQLASSLGHTGAAFFAPHYRLLVDRDALILEALPESESLVVHQIEETNQVLELSDGRLSLHRHSGRPGFFTSDTTEAALDADILEFPLRLRRWQEGDVFQPLGMGGQHQKVQDFFTNYKVPRFDKEMAWILEDRLGRICWVVGYRIDDRFRIRADTKAYWALKFEKV